MAFAPSTSLTIESSAFADGEQIPRDFTQEGANVSPPLAWSGAPEKTKGYAVICHDPDAPLVEAGRYGYVHWTAYNIPASTTELEQGKAAFSSGKNDADAAGYVGPMPPEGHGTHRYYFWILALDEETELEEGLTMSELLEKVEPHLLAMNRLVGTYERAPKTP